MTNDDHPKLKQGTRRERQAERQSRLAEGTNQGLHVAEDIVYALTALILVSGALIILGVVVYHFARDASKGVEKAIEATLDSLLIVFILVELLAAVRTAISHHELVAEPFLLVGILAAIKEMVVVATFRIDRQKPTDTALKIGVLGAVIIALALATYILRRREREPEEDGDTTSEES